MLMMMKTVGAQEIRKIYVQFSKSCCEAKYNNIRRTQNQPGRSMVKVEII
jgi:hypothetical protein